MTNSHGAAFMRLLGGNADIRALLVVEARRETPAPRRYYVKAKLQSSRKVIVHKQCQCSTLSTLYRKSASSSKSTPLPSGRARKDCTRKDQASSRILKVRSQASNHSPRHEKACWSYRCSCAHCTALTDWAKSAEGEQNSQKVVVI